MKKHLLTLIFALGLMAWAGKLRSQASGLRFLSVLSAGRERPGVMPRA